MRERKMKGHERNEKNEFNCPYISFQLNSFFIHVLSLFLSFPFISFHFLSLSFHSLSLPFMFHSFPVISFRIAFICLSFSYHVRSLSFNLAAKVRKIVFQYLRRQKSLGEKIVRVRIRKVRDKNENKLACES